jgi:hypothetical protein
MSNKYCLKKFILVILVAQIVFCQGCLIGDKVRCPVKVKDTPNTFTISKRDWGSDISYVKVFRGKVVWHIEAVEKVPGKNFQVCVGEVPDRFEQLVPTGQKQFVPVCGEQYTLEISDGPGWRGIFGTIWIAD